ncbi:hypothetical protein [Paenibacillus sp. FSL L8-0708]|uniref:hypothetical protein n=1 Tax=Paenibacillus sp. FSL L8-0708 TaxID=2975311 RepID=UPI0030F62EAF
MWRTSYSVAVNPLHPVSHSAIYAVASNVVHSGSSVGSSVIVGATSAGTSCAISCVVADGYLPVTSVSPTLSAVANINASIMRIST